MLTKYFMTVTLLSLLHQSTCWSYCIVSENHDVEANSSCITLNKFSRLPYNIHPEAALAFQPGNHILSINISVFNISEFKISALQSTNTTIVCKNRARFVVNKVRNVSISDTTFIGCGGNLFMTVDNLLVENSTFTGSEESLTALLLYNTTSALIITTKFSSNHKSSYKGGSTIIAYRSSLVSVDKSVFRNNTGAIYADRQRAISFMRCQFLSTGMKLLLLQTVLCHLKAAYFQTIY